MSYPTISALRSITYTDDQGKIKEFKLTESISDSWQVAAKCLSLKPDKYRVENNDVESCENVLSKWIKRNGHKDYPLTWQGLHDLLSDMGRRKAADKLFKALKNSETSENKYYDTMSSYI